MPSNAPMGIIHLQQGERKFQLSRYAPGDDIAPFVRHYWVVRWDLAGQEPYTQHVIPNPCVNLVIEQGSSAIFGPGKEKYGYHLKGQGSVFGVKFKPGGFYPFVKGAVSDLLEQPVGIDRVFDREPRALEALVLSHSDDQRNVNLVEDMIRAKLPLPDEQVALVNDMVDFIYAQPDMTKVDALCEHFGMNIRTLQRLFDQYVGVSPKWVIKIARIQSAAETTDGNDTHDWAKLSMDLGYHDQSHFIKDFKSILGQTPEAYAVSKRAK
ncbi:AraC family transcriptional regulator [Paenibacillus roseipurpureus]|uniref:AraC family transcriptional regulator n=1 Tax=Paenibacillus roseopurpureus TaxID=2918901 RepID=A0AA96LPS6_9BACL|nr:AraC family transcriptional regulator [Paenibacillus sp. MBLB1832]WNR44381.1 AraC family transcriptional regulator [Paenibacillus sp. MBLB1832]